jgi:methionyl-tRNA synthetase
MSQRRYVTTAIDYPNAAPHMGHALEKILADIVARWFRLRGDEVRFQIGTDEHGIKIQQTAKKEGLTPKELVDRNVPLFQDLYTRLGISSDVFVRTSDQAVHWPTVIALWQALSRGGALEKRTYEGLYCSGCERFITEKDLVDGLCPDHKIAPEKVSEENWFLLLSLQQKELEKLLDPQTGTYKIVPDYRAEETLALLKQGLEDVSFSRPRKTLSWGVPVPGEEEEQVMYVWCDALTNYISTLGLLTPKAQPEWWDDAEVTHVIGKDIARFHALIWPGMLSFVGLKTPDRLLIHGFLTSDGQKMSKSLGNVVSPEDVLARFGGNPDPLRFFLSHEVPVGRDGDFSWKRIEEMYDAKLRNQLGNMLNRVLVMLKRQESTLVFGDEPAMATLLNAAWTDYRAAMDAFEMHRAIGEVFRVVDGINVAMQQEEPWKKQGEEQVKILTRFAEVLRHVSLMLLPFMPDTALRIAQQLGVPYAERMTEPDFTLTDEFTQWGGAIGWKTVGEPAILFAPLEE